MQGAFLFEAVITAQQWAYITASTCGGFLYSYCEFMLRQMKTPILPKARTAGDGKGKEAK